MSPAPFAIVTLLVSSLAVTTARADEACFKRLDNGTDLTGWHRSLTNHHGPGLGWTVENGAFVGRQTAGNQGGLLMTDGMYKDVEVVFEVKIDWGCDSGFFVRTTAGDRAYQILVDHLPQGSIGPYYGEGFATEFYYHPYFVTDMGAKAVKDPVLTPLFDLAQWPTLWKPTEWNEIRARVEGNPPHLQTWIAGVKVADYTDPSKRAEINESGPLAIQVHAGADRWKPGGTVQFRNLRVKDLTVPCVSAPDGGAGDARDGTVADARDGGGAGTGGAGGTGGGAGTGGAAETGGAGGTSGAAGTGTSGGAGGAGGSSVGSGMTGASPGAGGAGAAGSKGGVAPTPAGKSTGCDYSVAASRAGDMTASMLLAAGVVVGLVRRRPRKFKARRV